jgi:glutamate synthase domain-containing protein 3
MPSFIETGLKTMSNERAVNMADSFANQTLAFEQLTVGQTAVAFTREKLSHVVKAVITVETNAVRIRTDGTAPTASIGLLIPAGTILELTGTAELYGFKAICKEGTGNAILNIEYKG